MSTADEKYKALRLAIQCLGRRNEGAAAKIIEEIMMILLKFKFKEHVYEPQFDSCYDKYKGHTFIIDHVHPEDPCGHAWLKCLDDPTIIVAGYVDVYDIEAV